MRLQITSCCCYYKVDSELCVGDVAGCVKLQTYVTFPISHCKKSKYSADEYMTCTILFIHQKVVRPPAIYYMHLARHVL